MTKIEVIDYINYLISLFPLYYGDKERTNKIKNMVMIYTHKLKLMKEGEM